MYPGGATDAVRHFAGHMRVHEATLHLGDVYLDPAYPGTVGQDHDPWVPDITQHLPLELPKPITIRVGVTNDNGQLIKVPVGHTTAPTVKFALPQAPAAPIDAVDFSPPVFYGGMMLSVTATRPMDLFMRAFCRNLRRRRILVSPGRQIGRAHV